MEIILSYLMSHLETVITLVIVGIVTVIFNKSLTPKQQEQVKEISKEIKDLYEKVKALIIDIEQNPLKVNEKLSNPLSYITPLLSEPEKEFKGVEKERIAMQYIAEKFSEREKSIMIDKKGSILEFVKDAYSFAKPIISIIRLIKRGK